MKSIKIEVRGIVQGVGFRPFIYQEAIKHNLTGWVNNDSKSVNILLQGSTNDIKDFLYILKNNPPVLAKIDEIKEHIFTSKEIFSTFIIKKSENTNNKTTLISADISTCKDCLEDIKSEDNFRFNYALTNCTNCGPRYSIINTVPYDRSNTSMKDFKLCFKCEKEYLNPNNRRYHAQPIACEECGPKISLYNKKQKVISTGISAIKEIAKFINDGSIVAIKGLGGFHIICDARNYKSINELRTKKNRISKPFAVMFKDLEEVKKHTILSKKEEELIDSIQKPITLVKKSKTYSLEKNVAPNIDRLGCFLPYTALHHLLFKYLNNEIIATSANLSDEPIIKDKENIFLKLSNIVDYILDFSRDILNACDDSIVQVIKEDMVVLRNARGFAPTSFKLPFKTNKKILALGANQKNSISLAFDDTLIVSPHIGDLNSIKSMEFFKKTIKTFEDFYDFKADIIVCDKHENYETTKWAKEQKNIELIQVQHHYAHFLATMAEYSLDEDVLAFVFDGTGYGDDSNIWGGEVFIGNKDEYKRIKHFDYFKLLGSQKAIKEPRRVALSLLFEHYSLDEVFALDLACVKSFSTKEIKSLYIMWEKDLNSPKTSSVGRLFDALASFASLCQIQTYEGETGLVLEQYYNQNIKESFAYLIKDEIINIDEAILEIIKEKDKSILISKFINMLVNIICEIALENKGLKVILSGGVFQNKTLLRKTIESLDKLNIEYYYSKKIPLNDAGVSIGQIYHVL